MRSQTVGSLMGLLTMMMRQVFQHLIQCPRAFPVRMSCRHSGVKPPQRLNACQIDPERSARGLRQALAPQRARQGLFNALQPL